MNSVAAAASRGDLGGTCTILANACTIFWSKTEVTTNGVAPLERDIHVCDSETGVVEIEQEGVEGAGCIRYIGLACQLCRGAARALSTEHPSRPQNAARSTHCGQMRAQWSSDVWSQQASPLLSPPATTVLCQLRQELFMLCCAIIHDPLFEILTQPTPWGRNSCSK